MFTFSESVRYFNKYGIKVYCAFLDVSKAFDKVLINEVNGIGEISHPYPSQPLDQFGYRFKHINHVRRGSRYAKFD